MTLEEMRLRQQAISARMAAIAVECRAEGVTADVLTRLDEEQENLINERGELQRKKIELSSAVNFNNVVSTVAPSATSDTKSEPERRAELFILEKRTAINVPEIRSVLLSSDGIAKPTRVAGINDMLPTAMSIVDQVMITDATGCGEYNISFQKEMQKASEKKDGEAQTGSDAKFGSVSISPTLLATTTYVSRELSKQSPLAYLEKVRAGALKSLKVKLAEWVTKGAGAGKMKGILNSIDNAPAPSPMNQEYIVNKTTVDSRFLRKFILSYGGDVNAYGGIGILYLNKEDLLAFGDIEGADKKAVYEITPDSNNPNTGIIKEGGMSVKYCLNSNITALSTSTVPLDDKKISTMVYGVPTNYELALFGNYEITESRDYKFAEGLITIMGEVMVGGSVSVKNGFIVATLQKTV